MWKTPSVQDLRDRGCKVKVRHFRYTNKRDYPVSNFSLSPDEEILPYGGETLVSITDPNGNVFNGSAECSIKDNYDRKLGVKIAIGRALT